MATTNCGLQGGLQGEFPETGTVCTPTNSWRVEVLKKYLREHGGRISRRNHELLERQGETTSLKINCTNWLFLVPHK